MAFDTGPRRYTGREATVVAIWLRRIRLWVREFLRIMLVRRMRMLSPPQMLPKLGWLLVLGWACSICPQPLRAQEGVTAAISGHGSDIDSALQSSLNLSASAPSQSGKPTIEQVRRDRDRLNAVLRAFGLYEGRIDILVNGRPVAIDRPDAATALQAAFAEPLVHILFVPTFGPVYRVRSVQVMTGPNGETRTLSDSESGLSEQISGRLAMAETMARIEAAWLQQQRETGHALAAVIARTVALHAESHSVDVTLAVEKGPQAKLGSVRFAGLQRIEPDSLDQYVPFRPGDLYRPALIDRLRGTLQHLPFFQSVRVDLATALDDSGLLPVTVTVIERPPAARQLFLSGLMGTVVFGLSAAMVALTQLAAAGAPRFWDRHGRRINTATWVLLLASALLGLQRLLYLANA